MPTSQRVIVGLAAATGVLIGAESLAGARSWHGIREGDWVVFALAAAFLAALVLAKRRSPKVALAGLAAVCSLALVEAALAVLCHDPRRPENWYVWPPRYSCRVTPREMPGCSDTGRFTINSLGLRGREPKPDDCYRILCVGGSTTECFYIDDALTWPALLEQTLAKSHPQVWVGNAGRSGLTSFDHVTLLERLPEAELADCWIVLAGVNDLGHQISGAYSTSKRQTLERTFCFRRPGYSGRLERPAYRNLYSFCLLTHTIQYLRLAAKTRPGDVVQDREAAWYGEVRKWRAAAPKTDLLPDISGLLAEFEANLRRIVALARARRKDLILMTQPMLWHRELPSELESLCWAGRLNDGKTYLSIAALAEAIDACNRRLRQVAASERVTCVDLAGLLPRTTDVFYDDGHFNEPGCRRVAQCVAQAFETVSPSERGRTVASPSGVLAGGSSGAGQSAGGDALSNSPDAVAPLEQANRREASPLRQRR